MEYYIGNRRAVSRLKLDARSGRLFSAAQAGLSVRLSELLAEGGAA